MVAAGSVVQIVFVDFELEAHSTCRFDYLEIAEGNDANRQKINRYCGNTHPNIITFNSNKVTVRFRTDPSNHFRGFHIKYTTGELIQKIRFCDFFTIIKNLSIEASKLQIDRIHLIFNILFLILQNVIM